MNDQPTPMIRKKAAEWLYLGACAVVVAFVVFNLVRGRTGSAAGEGVLAVGLLVAFVSFRRTRFRIEAGKYDQPSGVDADQVDADQVDADPDAPPRGQYGPTADHGDE